MGQFGGILAEKLRAQTRIIVLNRLSATYECDRQTDGLTDILVATSTLNCVEWPQLVEMVNAMMTRRSGVNMRSDCNRC